MSIGHLLIWSNITAVVNVVFQEIVVLATVRHKVISKRVTVQKKNVIISNIQMQVICDIPVLSKKCKFSCISYKHNE